MQSAQVLPFLFENVGTTEAETKNPKCDGAGLSKELMWHRYGSTVGAAVTLIQSFALVLRLVHLERRVEQVLLFLEMAGLEARRDRGAWVAPGVEHVLPAVVLGRVQERLDARLGEAPGTRVQRLLLAPHDVLGVRIQVEVLLELSPRERVQLFDPRDCRVLDALVLAVLVKGGVDLPGAEDDPFDRVAIDHGLAVLRVGDDPPEVRVTREVVYRRPRKRMSQERLAEEDDQRCAEPPPSASPNAVGAFWKGTPTLSELTFYLSPQSMEEVCRRGHVHDLHVAVLMLTFQLVGAGEDARILVGELQVPFHPSRRVLGPLAVVAVR